MTTGSSLPLTYCLAPLISFARVAQKKVFRQQSWHLCTNEIKAVRSEGTDKWPLTEALGPEDLLVRAALLKRTPVGQLSDFSDRIKTELRSTMKIAPGKFLQEIISHPTLTRQIRTARTTASGAPIWEVTMAKAAGNTGLWQTLSTVRAPSYNSVSLLLALPILVITTSHA